jgi:endonuclease/exonuclease/phosphatase family metal-dependent hydrolase
MLRGWIEEAIEDHPLLLSGDFNADKNSPAYRYLTSGDHPLMDVFRAGETDWVDEGTFHGYGMEFPPQPIDWILASNHFSAVNAYVDRYYEGNLFPSDHYPIMSTLDWKTSSLV